MALHKVGAIDDNQMREFNALCAPKPKKLSAQEIIELRESNGLSQLAFAVILNVRLSSLQKWEQGISSPTAAQVKLLDLIHRKGLEILE